MGCNLVEGKKVYSAQHKKNFRRKGCQLLLLISKLISKTTPIY